MTATLADLAAWAETIRSVDDGRDLKYLVEKLESACKKCSENFLEGTLIAVCRDFNTGWWFANNPPGECLTIWKGVAAKLRELADQ